MCANLMMQWLVWIGLPMCAAGFGVNSAGNETTYHLGVLGPMTSLSQSFIAASILFDLDFQKNFRPELVQRFGPPIVEVPNLNPGLRIHTMVGTSNSDRAIGIRTAFDWVTGAPPVHKIDVLIGAALSAIAERVAGNAEAYLVPQVSWAATSPTLSDKGLYPLFARTVPSDHLQGQAMWAWIRTFEIPSTALVYGDEPYGSGLFDIIFDTADAAKEAYRIDRVKTPAIVPRADAFNATLSLEAVQAIRETGTRFILLCMGAEASFILYMMEQEGMLYSGEYQFLGSEGVTLSAHLTGPSQGLPLGFQKMHPTVDGPLFRHFEEMWKKMTLDDIYGAEARGHYMLDEMQVPLENASADTLMLEDFAAVDSLLPLGSFIFDAGYACVLAINELLNAGVPAQDIAGTTLVSKIAETAFEGITGNVSFDANHDRVGGGFQLWNVRDAHGGSQEHLGNIKFDPDASLDLLMAPVWVNGNGSYSPPASLLACQFGWETDTATGRCAPCTPGIGCGYDPDIGFPLGIIGPLYWPEVPIASVIFDLDFRKHREPALQDRFGPPIIDIPDLHPDLKMRPMIGNTNGEVNSGVETTLKWFVGADGFFQVAGLVGAAFSTISGPIAANAQVFETPQISFSSTSPAFSDKVLYPWFARSVVPDSVRGTAMWAWMQYYAVPSVAHCYTREPFGEGLFTAVADHATAAGQVGRVNGVGMATLGDVFDSASVEEVVQRIISVGSRFVFITSNSARLAEELLRAMERAGILYDSGAYQILGGLDILGFDGTQEYYPSRGLPVGLQDLLSVLEGPLYPRFMDMYWNLTQDDVYGPDAVQRYMLDDLVAPVTPNGFPTLDFSVAKPEWVAQLLFDAAYTYVVAINELLHAGYAANEIYGSLLLDQIANTSFEGTSGPVRYDVNRDRVGDFVLLNLQPTAGGGVAQVSAATYSVSSSTFTFHNANNEIYWAGGVVSATVPDFLVACMPGQRWDSSQGWCVFCPQNWYSQGGVGEEAVCISCDAGWVSDEPLGATACTPCAAGSFRAFGDANCTACPLGTFGSDSGQSACEDCIVGEYASTEGLTKCDICGEGRPRFTTMASVEVAGDTEYSYVTASTSPERCGCDRDSRHDANGNCIACSEGMNCKGMNDVRILSGYFAENITSDARLSIFKCHGDSKRCVGGFPGQTCATGREGLTCGECQDGKTPKSGGTCVECGGSDVGPFLVVVLVGIAALVFAYHIIDTQNRATQSHALLLCAIAVGQFITVTQQLGVVGMLSVDWEEPIKSFMALLGILSFNIEVLRLNCVSSQGPAERFAAKVFIILITIGIMLFIHGLFVLLRHKGRFKAQMHTLIGAIGTIFMVFNIAVTSTVLEPLQCQHHPNDSWTIRNYPSILCWEDSEHTFMLAFGTLFFFLVPVAYLAGAVVVVRQFPSRMRSGDAQFLKAFSFLFFRFKPERHSYVLVTILRSFMVALVLVVPDVTTQVFMLQLILLLAYSSTLYWLPWRVELANLLDALFGAGAVILVCLTSMFIPSEDKDLTGIAWLTTIFIVCMLVSAPVAILYGLHKKYLRSARPYQFFLCHHKNGSGAYTRLLKMHLVVKATRGVFVDSDNLDNLDRLFDYVGSDTDILVVIANEEIFSRPWCVGEMCTAMLKSIKTIVVALPSCVFPSASFIQDPSARITDMQVLTENGMSDEMVADALGWISSCPCIQVPEVLNVAVMSLLADKLVTMDLTDIAVTSSLHKGSTHAVPNGYAKENIILYDFANMEAAATAFVLKDLLGPLMVHDSEKAPRPVESAEQVIAGLVEVVIPVCMNGLFANSEVLKILVQTGKGTCGFVPVIAEQSFRFPSKDLSVQTRQAVNAGLDEASADACAVMIATLFKEIAIDFNAQHASESHLRLAATNICQRVVLAYKGGNTGKKTPMASVVSANSIRATASQASVSTEDKTKASSEEKTLVAKVQEPLQPLPRAVSPSETHFTGEDSEESRISQI